MVWLKKRKKTKEKGKKKQKKRWEGRRKEVKLEEKQEGRKKRRRERENISDKGIYKINGKPFQKTKNLELNFKNYVFPLTYSWSKFNSLVKFIHSITL